MSTNNATVLFYSLNITNFEKKTMFNTNIKNYHI